MCSEVLTDKLPKGLLFNFHHAGFFRTFRANGVVLDPFSGDLYVYDTTSREAAGEITYREPDVPACTLSDVRKRMALAKGPEKLTPAQMLELEHLLSRGVRKGTINPRRQSYDSGRSTLLAAWPDCKLLIAQRGEFVVVPANQDQKNLFHWFDKLFEGRLQ